MNNIDLYIKKLHIECYPILDISKEMLMNTDFINAIDKMNIEDSDKKLFREYYNKSRLC